MGKYCDEYDYSKVHPLCKHLDFVHLLLSKAQGRPRSTLGA